MPCPASPWDMPCTFPGANFVHSAHSYTFSAVSSDPEQITIYNQLFHQLPIHFQLIIHQSIVHQKTINHQVTVQYN